MKAKPSPPLSTSSSLLHIHRYLYFRRKLAGTSSVTLSSPHWRNGRQQRNHVSFLCLHSSGVYADINHHAVAHPCCASTTNVWGFVTPLFANNKRRTHPCWAVPSRARSSSVEQNRHRIAYHQLIFIIMATGASSPSWMSTWQMLHA